ncbi:hypothetical protein [Actinoplanes xinjiangensis]|uniref:hypothetical protein n=1 Tax=Actinoplanes xinjiangensis TaxID=512350 RepID=UPI0034139E81
MLADVAFVVHRVGVAGHGVGAILGYAAKLSGKVLCGFVPVLGAVVAGGVNAWIVDGILDAAKDYYTDKLGILGGGAAGRALPGGA